MARTLHRALAAVLLCASSLAVAVPAAHAAAETQASAKKSASKSKATTSKATTGKASTSKAAATKSKGKPEAKRTAEKKPAHAAKHAGNTKKTKTAALNKGSAPIVANVRRASFGPMSSASENDEGHFPGGHLSLRSSTAFVQDLNSNDVLFAKNDTAVVPIASITKLMTALVVIDGGQDLEEMVEITTDDIDTYKNTRSRLVVGTQLSRTDLLHLALMSSENRAASALGRNYPGGLRAFVQAMNAKAILLGMHDTHYVEPTGLSSSNVSSPRDLVRLMQTAVTRSLIHQYTTSTSYSVDVRGRQQTFHNTNQLVSKPDWGITVSKTGFINEAGRCLVMLANIGGRELAIVLLDSVGSFTRTADAVRVRQWLQREVGKTL